MFGAPIMSKSEKPDHPASVGKINPSGIAAHIWSTKDYGNQSPDAMMAAAIGEGKVKDPGVYIACWCNADGIPFGRIYTVRTSRGGLEVLTGIRADRVTRWPPRRP